MDVSQHFKILKRALVSFIILFSLFSILSFSDNISPIASPLPTLTASSDKKTTQTLIPPPKREVPGIHCSLTTGTLFVPDFYDPSLSEKTEIVVFFHGATWCSEQGFYDAKKNAILVSVSLKDFSMFQKAFANPESLENILSEAEVFLKTKNITNKPIGKICIASFSGGYLAVREILKQKQFRDRISDIVLADSLYAPKTKEKEDEIDKESMSPFLNYAKAAVQGKCTFLFSHLYPPEERYRNNTSTLTATYLINQVGAVKKPASGKNSRGAILLYRADLGNFHILGYSGMTTQDHFEHFYSISDLYKETSLTPAKIK